tara:strand:+ start:728 stop:1612 length:885 start_codon:yes stop_codon:yes gene_type:complete
MKLAFGMIVFEGDYVLQECLEQVYPYASQILIAEGPVTFWQNQGRTTSLDDTNKILDEFPDPENKIVVEHGKYYEKDEQCRTYMNHINDDIDYIWNLDSDELFKSEDIEKVISFLEEYDPTSVGVRSCSFYGGFDHYLTGFELNRDNFLRIFKYKPGSTWATHRPPTIHYPAEYDVKTRHVDSETLYNMLGVQMYHYSYVFPDQVFKKVSYYKDSVSKDRCIDNYFNDVYLPWVTGDNRQRMLIEKMYRGVHEFKPEARGDCFTEKFTLEHPLSIRNNIDLLKHNFNNQLSTYV